MQQTHSASWLSRKGLAGGLVGLSVALLASWLLAGSSAFTLLAGVGFIAAGYFWGCAVSARGHTRELARRNSDLRAELRLSQDHIMDHGSFRSLGSWLDATSKWLKTPLRDLASAASSLANDAVLSEEARQRARQIASTSETLAQALGPLADYSLVTPSKAPFNINNLLREAVDLCRHRAGEKKIRFDERYGLVPPIFGPSGRVQSALLNVIVNAVEAMPFEGGGIKVETALQGDRVIARIHDTGIGIRPEHLRKVFEPFFTTKPDRGGAGLGLWETRDTLDRLGATIDISSVALQGTEVAISFPQAAPLAAGRTGVAHPPELPRNTADEGDRQIA